MKLTEEQLKVVNSKAKLIELNAYAGTGKTLTKIKRIERLLNSGVTPDQILVLTFSNRTTEHIKKRLPENISVQTFHAFSFSIVKQHYEALGFTKKPKNILEGKSKLKLLKKALKKSKASCKSLKEQEVDLADKKEQVRLLKFLDLVQGSKGLVKSVINDRRLEFDIYKNVLSQINDIYKAFNAVKIKSNVIDYSDMIKHGRRVVKLAAEDWSYKYLFIDESQDMTRGQTLLLKLLAAEIPNIAVFGDPYQSIYGFAGSSYQKLSTTLGREVKTFQLTKSFRLTQPNADLVSAIFKDIDKQAPQIYGRSSSIKPLLIKTEDQGKVVADRIERIRKNNPEASIAVLARVKSQLPEIEAHVNGKQLEVNPVARDLHKEHFPIVLNLIKLLSKYEEASADGKKIAKDVIESKMLSIAKINVDVRKTKLQECRRVFQDAVLNKSFLGRYMAMHKLYLKLIRVAWKGRAAEIKSLDNALAQMEPYFGEFKNVEDALAALSALRNTLPVITSTIHAAKGLEYDYVFVLSVAQGSLPFYRQIESGEIDEERRLFYVACSRARKKTILIQAPYTTKGKTHGKKSEFLTKSVLSQLS